MSIQVISGPTVIELFQRISAPQGSNEVVFGTPDGPIRLLIDSMEREDGSGRNFNIRGYFMTGSTPECYQRHNVAIYYNVDRQTGAISSVMVG